MDRPFAKSPRRFFLALLLSLQLVCVAAHSADQIRLAVPDGGGQLLNVSRYAPLRELFDSTLLRQAQAELGVNQK